MKDLYSELNIHDSVFIAPNATVIGKVRLGQDVSIWYGAVLRGDNDHIHIGARSNIQDNAVLHVDPGVPISIGKECVIGHGAIVHGANLADNVLIGMNAVVLNNAQIGKNCIIGANALVTTAMVIPEGSLVLGSPAKVVKQLTPEQIAGIKRNAEVYVKKGQEFKELYRN